MVKGKETKEMRGCSPFRAKALEQKYPRAYFSENVASASRFLGADGSFGEKIVFGRARVDV